MTNQNDMDQSSEPGADHPIMFGGQLAPVRLPRSWAVSRLLSARNYWIATTRPDGRPHSRPVWGIWLKDVFYFSTGSLAARNLTTNPAVTMHLESGSEVVLIEGLAELVNSADLTRCIVVLYNAKYHWDVDAEHLPGPFYAVRPQVAFGWVSDDTGLDQGSAFHGTATRWHFKSPQRAGGETGGSA